MASIDRYFPLNSQLQIIVDFGHGLTEVMQNKDCVVKFDSLHLDVGDKVEVQIEGTFLFAAGYITYSNSDGTYDVTMEKERDFIGGGDDDDDEEEDDDIEHHVPPSRIRKLLPRFTVAKQRWRRATTAVIAVSKFQGPNK